MNPVLRIEDLRIETTGEAPRTLVDGVTLQVDRGESLGVVGESGSGKSLTVLAALGLLPAGTRIAAGRILLDDAVLVDTEADIWMRERELRGLRGRTAAMVFQDPMSSLDPLRAVGAQVAAAVRVHQPMSRRAARERAVELLTAVGVRDAAERAAARPHQWSGGMRQRAMIAMAIAHDPLLLIADEPTTALDVTVQAQVMDLLAEVRERTGSALVLITHDLGLVAENSDRLAVMHHGRVVETGVTRAVLDNPAEDYTKRLMAAIPAESERSASAVRPGEPDALVADGVVVEYRVHGRRQPVRAVDGVSLRIAAGETVAVVGESGCGKSSLAKAVLGVQPAAAGSIELGGVAVHNELAARSAAERERAQIVFQDPYSALDPRLTVHDLVAEPLRIRHAYDRGTVTRLLADVGLDEQHGARLPAQLSGGQRQRVGIARALALRPRLLVLDEPVSALDVSIQAQVLELLDALQREHGLGYLFISHDLGVVRSIADRVVVMQEGRIVEEAPTAEIFTSPKHPFTRQLLDAVPRLDGARRGAHPLPVS
ncbi:ABC transporter ATP-binding protein [Pseudoclavibacter sp. RFBJ3]|uniref:dipeptide ABC transporter ATP-binding protein n=1 Tax=unclassified Pseudoclavibacter TaxID=2615177 RepID=UPI000CE88AF1|nr:MULTISPECIES: ABC transporter ATP-binding protein [unclassified Pseudoclavibacter]PPF81710.1 ABC transporter ATP-binding protein [Pseudoclavibacter sp. RFBJ5]PPF91040.1 ABC transporter ATP-binding protein [Pseudoclavibacter sp. RFBJ3]PPG00316.1 ABC transporter ATP-binding protein [Pseudoclavibacter sp. RFBH5]PPG19331.1 ABC transporter ATP-binding protein [Pseudoclavibacter sp. RFBI4]